MGAAFEVYNVLGYGMAEAVYQQSLEIELSIRNIPFLIKPLVDVAYKGRELRTKYEPDLLVFDQIVVELKAHKALTSEHEAQLFNYLRISQRQVGYLINFGAASELEWKRFVITEKEKA